MVRKLVALVAICLIANCMKSCMAADCNACDDDCKPWNFSCKGRRTVCRNIAAGVGRYVDFVEATCANDPSRMSMQEQIADAIEWLIYLKYFKRSDFNGVTFRACHSLQSFTDGFTVNAGKVLIMEAEMRPRVLAGLIAHEMFHVGQYREQGNDKFRCEYGQHVLDGVAKTILKADLTFLQSVFGPGNKQERPAYEFDAKVRKSLNRVPISNWFKRLPRGRHVFTPWNNNQKCMDWSMSGDNNVYMFPCHSNDNQKWLWSGRNTLHSPENLEYCLTALSNNDVGMRLCSFGADQIWTRTASNEILGREGLCLDHNFVNNNVFMTDCHGGSNQKFYFHKRTPAHLMSLFNKECVDVITHTGTDNVYMHPCHDGTNQKWILGRDETLQSSWKLSKCLDWNHGDPNNNVYLYDCHNGKNQKWYFDDIGRLRTRHDSTMCLDVNLNTKNLYMHKCHLGSNQAFYFPPQDKCESCEFKYILMPNVANCVDWDYGGAHNNVYLHGCHTGANQQWALSQNLVVSPHDRKYCLTWQVGGVNNAVMRPCFEAKYQKWHLDNHGRLHSQYDSSKCLDHNGQGNLYVHDCHGGENQKFYFSSCQPGKKLVGSECKTCNYKCPANSFPKRACPQGFDHCSCSLGYSKGSSGCVRVPMPSSEPSPPAPTRSPSRGGPNTAPPGWALVGEGFCRDEQNKQGEFSMACSESNGLCSFDECVGKCKRDKSCVGVEFWHSREDRTGTCEIHKKRIASYKSFKGSACYTLTSRNSACGGVPSAPAGWSFVGEGFCRDEHGKQGDFSMGCSTSNGLCSFGECVTKCKAMSSCVAVEFWHSREDRTGTCELHETRITSYKKFTGSSCFVNSNRNN